MQASFLLDIIILQDILIKMNDTLTNEAFVKLFFVISITGLITYAIIAFTAFHTEYSDASDLELYQELKQGLPNPAVRADYEFENRIKYILIWTAEGNDQNNLGNGDELFFTNNCSFFDCYLTTEKMMLHGDYTNFDALILDVNIFTAWSNISLPKKRKKRQKYIFYGMKSSEHAPVCNIHTDKYFNWTWSYKLYSDILQPFIEIRDLNGDLVAPNSNVQWTSNITNLTDKDLQEVKNKSKAVAWEISNCDTKNKRIKFVKDLQQSLKEHSLRLDIYGCGMMECPQNNCSKIIERDYYFYLAYEDHIEEDFVTEEVLKAYDNGAVPIVMGGADYEKFLPTGSYINARFQSTENLAAFIAYCITNLDIYQSFFLWRKHYTISKSRFSTGICKLCALLHDNVRMTSHSSYETFRKWWIPGPLKEKCYPKGAVNKKAVLSYLNNTNKGIKP